MLNIGRKQYDSLMVAMHSAFRRRLVVHVQEHFPGYAAAAGEPGVAGLVELAVLRSQRRGYMAEREIALWLNLMVQLGAAFDEDPLLPWAGKLPDAPPGGDSFAQLNAIYDMAEAYVAKVAGEAGERQAAAIGRFIQASPQELVVQPAQSSDLLVNALARLYPEKHQAAGYPALQAFMQDTIARCLKAGINVKDKIVLVMLFDFILGWEAAANPAFVPALTDRLADMPLAELLQRMKALMQGLLGNSAKGR